jgi:hypothetical protein
MIDKKAKLDGKAPKLVKREYVGRAQKDANVPSAHKVPAYFKRYRAGSQHLGSTPAQFSQEYSAAIRVTPLHYEAGSRIQ